jgi:hypothetical protein
MVCGYRIRIQELAVAVVAVVAILPDRARGLVARAAMVRRAAPAAAADLGILAGRAVEVVMRSLW